MAISARVQFGIQKLKGGSKVDVVTSVVIISRWEIAVYIKYHFMTYYLLTDIVCNEF